MNKISAFIIAKNEAGRITKAIESLQTVAQEIIVVDSGSTDNTVQLATSLGCKVVHNDWPGYVAQKIFAEKQCQNDWVINLDADEILSDALQKEISYMISNNLENKYKGYWIDIILTLPNEKSPRLFAPSHRYLRLYNRKYVSFANIRDNSRTHDSAFLLPGLSEKDNLLPLLSPIYHNTIISISHLVEKLNFYTSQQALDLIDSRKKIYKTRICLEMFICIFRYFFLRRSFIFGLNGFIYSMILSFARFLRLAKTYEALHK